ncbi:MAG: hypothetical protein CMK00_00760 [Planctomycetes bacterium]|jgi:hypothetical protein|nr:hypothetical protein [Planctomycetota bacterium]HJO26159.1 hypothetical protein [Planctomycetota bacterium]
MSLNNELVKYLLVLALTPFWLPVARTLWSEFKDALKEDGGFSGPSPSRRERERLAEERRQQVDPLIHEPLAGRDRPVPSLRTGGGSFRRLK